MRTQRAWRAQQRDLIRDLRQMEAQRQDLFRLRQQVDASPLGRHRDHALKAFDHVMSEWERPYATLQHLLDHVSGHVNHPR